MESSNPKNKSLVCPVRKVAVSTLPEERVRVQLLHDLTEKLGFPASSIAIERELAQLPHLRNTRHKLPQRRADIICFAKGIHPAEELYPLLLIECKAVKLTSKMISQIVGYNYYLQAPFITLINHEEVRTGWYDASLQEYKFVSFLPTYPELLALIKGR